MARGKLGRPGAASRLLTLGLLAALGVGSLALASRLKSYPWPGYQQGYEPVQPIAFSHRQHAGDLKISCLYCHFAAEQSRHAGIPAANLCMNCHRFVIASWEVTFNEYLEALRANQAPRPIVSPELQKLYDSLGLDTELRPDTGMPGQPIAWVKVHNLPAYACFDHRAHVNAALTCQRCHGPVETMDRVRQVEDLSMGWCVNCHRQPGQPARGGRSAQPSTDCAVCHY